LNHRQSEARSQQAAGPLPPSVEVRIEELVLHGFAPGDRYRIGEAVERELSRMIAEQGAPPTLMGSGETDRVDGGSFHMAPHAKGGVIGKQIAHAVYGGLRQ